MNPEKRINFDFALLRAKTEVVLQAAGSVLRQLKENGDRRARIAHRDAQVLDADVQTVGAEIRSLRSESHQRGGILARAIFGVRQAIGAGVERLIASSLVDTDTAWEPSEWLRKLAWYFADRFYAYGEDRRPKKPDEATRRRGGHEAVRWLMAEYSRALEGDPKGERFQTWRLAYWLSHVVECRGNAPFVEVSLEEGHYRFRKDAYRWVRQFLGLEVGAETILSLPEELERKILEIWDGWQPKFRFHLQAAILGLGLVTLGLAGAAQGAWTWFAGVWLAVVGGVAAAWYGFFGREDQDTLIEKAAIPFAPEGAKAPEGADNYWGLVRDLERGRSIPPHSTNLVRGLLMGVFAATRTHKDWHTRLPRFTYMLTPKAAQAEVDGLPKEGFKGNGNPWSLAQLACEVEGDPKSTATRQLYGGVKVWSWRHILPMTLSGVVLGNILGVPLLGGSLGAIAGYTIGWHYNPPKNIWPELFVMRNIWAGTTLAAILTVLGINSTLAFSVQVLALASFLVYSYQVSVREVNVTGTRKFWWRLISTVGAFLALGLWFLGQVGHGSQALGAALNLSLVTAFLGYTLVEVLQGRYWDNRLSGSVAVLALAVSFILLSGGLTRGPLSKIFGWRTEESPVGVLLEEDRVWWTDLYEEAKAEVPDQVWANPSWAQRQWVRFWVTAGKPRWEAARPWLGDRLSFRLPVIGNLAVWLGLKLPEPGETVVTRPGAEKEAIKPTVPGVTIEFGIGWIDATGKLVVTPESNFKLALKDETGLKIKARELGAGKYFVEAERLSAETQYEVVLDEVPAALGTVSIKLLVESKMVSPPVFKYLGGEPELRAFYE